MRRARRYWLTALPAPVAVAVLAVLLGGCRETGSRAETLRIPLTDGWSVAGGGLGPLPATVPGTVHTDLLDGGVIPDPFLGAMEDSLAWIAETDWTYRLEFDVDGDVLARDRHELVFEGLDTYATVRLNGVSILTADNMFREWRAEVGSLLRPGPNELEVEFESALRRGRSLESRHRLDLPQGNDRGDPPTRAFTRKAAYHYGWDWGPRFVTAGIWRPVRLESWSGARIRDVRWDLRSLPNPEGDRPSATAEVWAEVEIEVAGEPASDLPLRLEVVSGDGTFPGAFSEVSLEPGIATVSVPVAIPNPRLWWPRGMGEQALYPATVRIRDVSAPESRATLDSHSERFGLRTVELVREPDGFGETFRFEVNGQPVFARGANVIPLDHFSPRADSSRYRALFRGAAHGNMNMLRVWGGGIYETDLFYDLADEHGILIWQDFMFANGLYPWDEGFLESVRAEARDQVRRLRDHPSLALWCGNNEIAEGWANWGWQRTHGYSASDSVEVWAGYQALFHGVLPEVLAELDPDRPYWPSSPSIGWGHPESLDRGDSHYWGVWWGREPFEIYAEKLPRFASEFGFQAYPGPATLRAFASSGDLALGSPEMRAHQKHPTGVETLEVYLQRELGTELTDRLLARAGWSGAAEEGGLRDFALMTQLLQARGMDVALRAHRMSPRTDGTLFWQMNDTWPVASWSGVDYFGRLKGVHYAARSAFAPVALGWDPGRRTVVAASDLDDGVPGRVEFAFARPGPAPVEGGMAPAELRPGRGTDLLELDLPLLPDGSLVGVRFVPEVEEAGPAAGVPTAAEPAPPGPLARFTWVLGSWADLPGHEAGSGVEVVVEGADAGDLVLSVRATRASVGVHLEPDRPGFLSDDFFDLLPGEERRLRFTPAGTDAGDGPGAAPMGPASFSIWTLNEALARLRR